MSNPLYLRFMKRWPLRIALLALSAVAQADPSTATETNLPGTPPVERTAENFARSKRANERFDLANIDFELLSTAVVHETNKRRQQLALAPLRPLTKLREAAQLQALIMAKRGTISHVNPEFPEKKNPVDRFRLVGLTPAFTAENVATAFGLDYKGGTKVYSREENAKKLFSYEPAGQPIGMHTYLSFAQALLDSWMASPHHRENIVSISPEFVDASCQPGTDRIGMPIFYCAQVFYKPMPPGTQSRQAAGR